MARLIKANGAEIEIKPKNGSTFTLEELQKVVGGYIELVPTKIGNHMYVNEEGKLQNLAFNPSATRLMKYRGDYVVGDAILLMPGEEENE